MKKEMRQIMGFERYSIGESGQVFNTDSGREIQSFIDGIHNVRKVALFKDGREYKRLVHRLVALAYIEKTGTIVVHIDGDKLNNHWTNLKWSKRVAPQR